ncbi:MAG: ATP-binding cassette domain-containing protein [Chitinophagales bacterium]
MDLFTLLRQEIKQPLLFFLGAILLTGLSSAFLVELINIAAENIVNKNIQQWYFLCFIIVVGVFYFCREYIFDQAIVNVENSVNQLRQRIGDKIRHLSLSTFEQTENAHLYARLTQDMIYISTVSFHLIGLIQAIFMIVFMLLYIMILSTWAFVLVTTAIGLSMLFYSNILKEINYNFSQLSKVETDFLKKLNHLIKGFKEIKINALKSKLVFKKYRKSGHQKKHYKIKINQLYNTGFSSAQVFLYTTIAAIIFVIPQYEESHAAIIIKITAAVLFIIGPLEVILRVVPRLAYANRGAINVMKLEKEMDVFLKEQRRKYDFKTNSNEVLSFQKSIELNDLVYQYEHNDPAHAFSIGPMNLKVKKGELIFITGGNGSGKSTFLKMFTGLYLPKRGYIYLDRDMEKGEQGTLVNGYNYDEYSNLFTTIFTDFHLFDKLYGLGEVEEERVKTLLKGMGLSEDKTTFQKNRFTNIHLSSGQKKRLALITSMLEDKEVYIFDEVAADLDPEFRDTYYYEILPQLKAQNKTVFVVSHDKSYWKVADRVLELKNGQFYEKNDYTSK